MGRVSRKAKLFGLLVEHTASKGPSERTVTTLLGGGD
eukprot:COSAG02_NODE_60607_length_271_cov_0.418605_1_plen_36_part_10